MSWKVRLASPPYIILWVALAGLAWAAFAPMAVGGQAGYVIISGISMEPLYHTGDLVIVRRATKAEVGEIFAYRYPGLGNVIHRIVAQKNERFVFKGDNNDWLDGYEPSSEDLVGRAWVHIPGLGKALLWARQPVNMVLLAALIGGFLMFGFLRDLFSNLKNKKIQFPAWHPDPGARETGLFFFSLLLFVSIVLGLLAFSTPATRLVNDDLNYQHSISYAYTAPANPRVYDSEQIQAGEPLFNKLGCQLEISQSYTFITTVPFTLQGTYRTLAVVSEPNGWKHTLELQRATSFTDGAFVSRSILDVCALRKIIENVEMLTGLARSVYNISIITEIEQSGDLANRAYHEKVSGQLSFGLDNVQLYVLRGMDEQTDPLLWKRDGKVAGEKEIANTLPFFGMTLAVLPVRIFASLGFFLALGGMLFFSLPLFTPPAQTSLEALRGKYTAHQVVRLVSGPHKPLRGHTQVDVQSLDDLGRIASQTGRIILEYQVADETHFIVTVEKQTYRYIFRPSQDAS